MLVCMELMRKNEYCEHCGNPSYGEDFCCDACRKLSAVFYLVKPKELLSSTFAYLDEPSFRELYHHKNSEYNYVFYAEGLHCSSCVHLLEKLPDFYSEIENARVNFGCSTVSLHLSPQGSLAHVASIIQELGYTPSPLAQKDDFQEKYVQENRLFLKRIAVAGACTGNIMIFVIPVYSGLAGSLGTLFNWISFILYLPILFYSAVPFYVGAWNSLKYKVVNVDLPITIAMLLGVTLSTVNLVRGSGNIYYDSTASFMFFILSARYLLKRTQQNYLSPTQMEHLFKSEKFMVEQTDGTWRPLPAAQIQAHQILKISTGQSIPADGILLSEKAFVDTSMFNGESFPRYFSKGMLLHGGTKVLSEEIIVESSCTQSDSQIGILLRELNQSALQKTSFIALTDRLARTLIMTVFSLAGIFLAIYSWIDFSEAFNRSLALIVLACPCALAFGSPLTFGLALKKAQKIGILIKDGSVLERLSQLRYLFFDKTGTLTKGQLTLSHSDPAELDLGLIRSVLAIESGSYHPVAFALRQAWKEIDQVSFADNIKEVLGTGVKGQVNGHNWEVKNLSESLDESEMAVGVFKDQELVAKLYFADQIREESRQVVHDLAKWNIETHLITGDRWHRAYDMAAQCGIQKEHTQAELRPEDKRSLIVQYKSTCMIGDGANDSLALKVADIGIAIKGSVDLSLASADVYFTRGGLQPLVDLLKISRIASRVLRRNLALSLFYNLVGGVLALTGFISPMLAAILMPISSFLIVLSTVWGLE